MHHEKGRKEAEMEVAMKEAATLQKQVEDAMDDEDWGEEDPDGALEEEAAARHDKSMKEAAVMLTELRESHFASDTVITKVKTGMAAYCESEKEKVAVDMAMKFDLKVDDVKAALAETFTAFSEMKGTKKEKRLADAVIHPNYPDKPVKAASPLSVCCVSVCVCVGV